jgi:hypothetical protein
VDKVSKPDLEAKVTPKIAEAFQAAVEKIGRTAFLAMAEMDDQRLQTILSGSDEFVSIGLVTLACQINKSHNDPNPNHSSVTECLKGSTIRIPSTGQPASPRIIAKSISSSQFRRLKSDAKSAGPLYDQKTTRLIGFSANTIAFLILGYFLGGIALSPFLGQPPCIGVSVSPPALVPCSGSIIGLVVSAIGGIGYTYYYFVKKL